VLSTATYLIWVEVPVPKLAALQPPHKGYLLIS
jgi:hypothetical protein